MYFKYILISLKSNQKVRLNKTVTDLGGDTDFVSDEVGGVETDTKLSDHGNVGAGGERLHERLGARLGDCSQVVDQIGLGHSDSGVLDGEAASLGVRNQFDFHLLLGVQLGWIRQGFVTDLVQSLTESRN